MIQREPAAGAEGHFSPLIRRDLLRKRLSSGHMLQTSDGREKLCPHCKEYWPTDTEFWYAFARSRDGLSDWCKACFRESRELRMHKAGRVEAPA